MNMRAEHENYDETRDLLRTVHGHAVAALLVLVWRLAWVK